MESKINPFAISGKVNNGINPNVTEVAIPYKKPFKLFMTYTFYKMSGKFLKNRLICQKQETKIPGKTGNLSGIKTIYIQYL